MKKSAIVSVAIVTLIAAAAVAFNALQSPAPLATTTETTEPAPVPSDSQKQSQDSAPSTQPLTKDGPATTSDTDDFLEQQPPVATDCISPKNAISHPLIVAELDRLAPILPIGDDFEVFRGANRNAVTSMAVQGDSAAMYILARMHMQAARGLPDSSAYRDILDFAQPRQFRRRPERTQPSEETRERETAEARKWLKQAALHGRLFAMIELSELEQRDGETIVTKGWITEAAFEELDQETRNNASIQNVYVAMADMLIPELATGLGGALREAEMHIEDLEPFAIFAADEFLADMSAIGQNLPVISASQGPDWETFKDSMCKPKNDGFNQ